MSASILIVEDHEKVRQALRSFLELEYSHYQIIEASSGEEAINLAVAKTPRLIIMDITLPGISGIEATRRILDKSSSLSVMIFSIHEDEIYRQEAREAGAMAYVTKNALQSELMPNISSLLVSD